MSADIVDFKKYQHLNDHKKKEEGFEKMKQQFETAMPTQESSKDKLLAIFKKKKNTRTPKKKS